MNLFDVKEELIKAYDTAIDPETGEVLEESALDALNDLQMEFDTKVENIACWIKNLKSDAEALKAEKQAFEKRLKTTENKIKNLQGFLSMLLQGEKRDYPRASISFRKSDAVVIDDFLSLEDEYLVYKDPEPDKAKIKRDLKQGVFIPGAHIEEHNNIQIK